MFKLKQKDLPELREAWLKKQKGICPICQKKIEADPVLDHDHKAGHCRATLHRECNSIEGKFANWFKTFGKDKDPVEVLHGIARYIQQDYSSNPLHPKHRTEDDKKLLKLKRRLKAAKRTETKERIKLEIKQLKQE